MGKKIRHLEFYGYADQNVYMGIPNVDLSDIRQVNKTQDKEISEISASTKDKASTSALNALSGKVDTFIGKQDDINKWLARGINKNKERIENLEAKDTEIIDKVNEVDEKVDGYSGAIETLSARVESVDERLTEHLQEASTFEEDTNERLDALEDAMDGKLSKDEADEIYISKEDGYTKEQIDDLIDDLSDEFATQQWVLDRGYLTEIDGDEKYATRQRLNALEDRVTSAETNLYHQYNELNSDLSQFKTVTNTRLDTIYDRVGTLDTKVDREISELEEDLSELGEDVEANSNAIYQINNVALPNKADKADLNTLESRVNTLSNNLDNKVDKTTYETDKARLGVQLDALDNKKADKTYANAISGAVNDLRGALDQEIQDRIDGDNALGLRIDDTNTAIEVIREENLGRDQKISDLERDLANEINDRVEADNAIIGSPSDRDEDNTIYGAKKYADKVAQNALNEAKGYTDVKDSAVRDYVDETKADLERQITAKADKNYVNAVKAEIETTIDDKVNTEKLRAQTAENGLENAIRQETLRAVNKETIISSALTHTSNVVHALTDWDGDDRASYSDSGNGIVDVLHREFHEFEQTAGSIKEIKVEDGLFIITYYTKEGEKTTEIPIAEFVDLSDYYTKEETDAAIQDAIQELVLDNYYTKAETDEKFDAIVDNASSDYDTLGKTEGKIEELIEKLGYDNNDTLVRMNEHEVAFGEYNMSVNSPDPAEQTIFSIGNGTSESERSNAIEVRKNGDVYMWVEDEYVKVNDLLAMLTHETY